MDTMTLATIRKRLKTHEIVGGTNNFAAATGTGTVEGSVTGEVASFTASGTVVY